MRVWYAVEVEIEAAACEAAEYALMEAGALGTETEERERQLVRVTAYFSEEPNRERVQTELTEAFRIYRLPASLLNEIASHMAMNVRKVADQDWLGEWKKNWQPVEVGERFIIAPPWSEIPDNHGRILIRVEPGMAFGTGTHETTRLCLAAIEEHFEGGSFLDVGTGTGLLSIAAAKLFPEARVEACDTDPLAVEIARENARLNGVAESITFRVGSVDDSVASANLVCANLTADVINSTLPALLSVTCGRLVLSGILDSQVDVVRARLRENGVTDPLETMQEGEWIALVI
jgi:ribosomal protein L11 methyltransferase